MCSKRTAHNKLSQEQIIEQFIEKHGDAFDYSNVKYVDVNTPVEVYCKKHDFTFYPTPKNHKKGSKCTHCGREAQIDKAKKDFETFKNQMFEIYGDKYSFNDSNYINTKTSLKAICKIHGEFEKQPSSLFKGSACDECAKNTKSNNKDVFIEEAIKVYGDKDDYTNTEVISSKHTITVRCTKHDYTFTKNIQPYLAGYGCPKCSSENYRKLRALPSEEYYERVNKKHENKYTYLGDYSTLSGVVTFFCEDHGKQRLNANSHLNGKGCKKCEKAPNKINKRTKDGYCKLAKDRPTKLYFLECFKDGERFYKIGKTFKEIHQRYSKSKMYYDYEIKYIHIGSAKDIWDLEENIHLKYKEFRYHPKKWFAGYSESYRLSLPIEDIWKTL